jgi:hypothetical protein
MLKLSCGRVRQVKGLRLIKAARQKQQLLLLLKCSCGSYVQVLQRWVYLPSKRGCKEEPWCAGSEGREKKFKK